MMKVKHLLWMMAWGMLASLYACSDDDTFTLSPNHLLTFSIDTLRLDTTFSTVPTPTKSFWVYNHSGDGIRCASIRLEKGNQTGFRVNVDGVYLGQTAGWQVSDVEIRNKDSIRVFVELTTPLNHAETPQNVTDDLIFTLESGQQQKVNLNAFSWDAEFMENVHVTKDSTITAGKPIVVYGGLQVDSFATLTIEPGTMLYFHGDAGLKVYGTLKCMGEPTKNVTLRGDRIDRMFSYLPYDRVSGQWQGVYLAESSYGNVLQYTDLHSAFDGLVCDSSDVTKQKLTMDASTIHNCQGYGLEAHHSLIALRNSQFSNTLHDCVFIDGGMADINQCTMAQFYPYDASRGAAIRFAANRYALHGMNCRNSLMTGYADDVLMGEPGIGDNAFEYAFENCIIRTPEVEEAEQPHFTDVTFEDVEDTVRTGRKHFISIDIENLSYDFHLSEVSPAISAANPLTALPTDRDGTPRDETPDIGCYEAIVKAEE